MDDLQRSDVDLADADRLRLIRGLIGERHRQTYHQVPEFHATIQALAGLIGTWVDALAAGAVDQDAARRQIILDLHTAPASPALTRELLARAGLA